MKNINKEKISEVKPGLIEKFSLYFAKNYRITALFLIGVLLLGFLSYTSFLKREGFPQLNIPVAIINVNYIAKDAADMDKTIIQPLENKINDIPEVTSIRSSNFGRSANIIISFESNTEDVEGLLERIEQKVAIDRSIPESADFTYRVINPASVNGVDDLLINIAIEGSENKNLTIEEIKSLQSKANTLITELSQINSVKEVRVINQINERQNPLDQSIIEVRDSFNRVIIKDGDNFQTYETVLVGIKKKENFSSVDLSKDISEKVESLKSESQFDTTKVIFGADPAVIVNRQISSLESNFMQGLFIVAILMLLIIGWRSSLIILVFIPVTLALSFISLFVLGYSLNVITLFALILVLGIIADDAIVVLEAIDYYKKQGLKSYSAVINAIKDIGVSDIAGTLTTVLVFIPMIFISGILGEFIRIMPITVIFTLLGSLLIGLSMVVFLSNILFKVKKENKENILEKSLNFFPELIEKASQTASNFVRFYLNFRFGYILVIISSIILIAGSIYIASPNIKFSIFPQSKDSNGIEITINYPEGYSLDEAIVKSKEAESIILNSEYAKYITKIDYTTANNRSANLSLDLTDLNTRDITAPDIAKNIQDKMDSIVPVNGSIKVIPLSAGGPPPSDFPVEIRVYSDSKDTLAKATKDIADYLADAVFDGYSITATRINNLEFIAKADGKRYATVQASVSEGYDSATLTKITNSVIEKFNDDYLKENNLSKDAISADLGQEQEFSESFQSAGVAFIAAVLIMYAFLVALYGSFLLPILIFVAVPFTLPGVFLGLWGTDNPISFFVFIGFIALFGVVVNNTIILLSSANAMIHDKKMNVKEAIIESTKIRTRPILATTLTTLGGLIPLALTDPFWEGLAYTIIFGLLSSFVFVIIAFPAYYIVFQNIRRVKRKLYSWIKKSLDLEI